MGKLYIIYEDENALVIDKPAGLSVQNSQERIPSLELKELISSKSIELVHRLDKDTSGILILAKDAETKQFLQKQFKERSVEKVYLALVRGVPKLKRAVLDWPIGRHPKNPLKRAVASSGKEAITEYRVISQSSDYSLLEVRPKTGRTHQIRVHLHKLGHPVVGDKLYGKADKKLGRMWLHSYRLAIRLLGGEKVLFTSELPPKLRKFNKSYNIEYENSDR